MGVIPHFREYRITKQLYPGFPALAYRIMLESELISQCLRHPIVLSLQITQALEYFVQNRTIYQDIKSTNILIHLETNQVKLTDDNIASNLSCEVKKTQNSSTLAQTLAIVTRCLRQALLSPKKLASINISSS